MGEETIMTHLFGDSPDIKFIGLFLIGRDLDYTMSDIAECGGISRSTAYKLVEKFQKNNFLQSKRKIGRIKLYSLNKENPEIKLLIKMFDQMLKLASEKEIERQGIKVKISSQK
jgi:DNA-binding MarR family transcriptional regulator